MEQYTTLIISSLRDLKEKSPEMSFGEMLYTIFRKKSFPTKPEGVDTTWFLSLNEEDIYNAVEKAIKLETETEIESE